MIGLTGMTGTYMPAALIDSSIVYGSSSLTILTRFLWSFVFRWVFSAKLFVKYRAQGMQ